MKEYTKHEKKLIILYDAMPKHMQEYITISFVEYWHEPPTKTDALQYFLLENVSSDDLVKMIDDFELITR